MKIAVTGRDSGRVRDELINEWGCIPLTCDITDRDAVFAVMEQVQPDVLIHAAAMTDVDACEANGERALFVNLRGTANVLDAFRGHFFVYLSTDHVFDGKRGPYSEAARPNPVNFYGLTKYAAEMLVRTAEHCTTTVVRTSKLFTVDDITNMLSVLMTTDGRYKMPVMIKRSFMFLPHFVESLVDFISLAMSNQAPVPDVLHIAGKDTVSYYRFWRDALGEMAPEYKDYILPRKEYYTGNAPRPKRGGLRMKLSKSIGLKQYDYRDGFRAIGTIAFTR